MTYLYFVYGLSFFTLGISVICFPRKGSEFLIAKTIVLVAVFGILHGLHEWAEMFGLMENSSGAAALKYLGLFLLPASFYFLVAFGMKSILREDAPVLAVHAAPAALFILWIVLTVAAGRHFLMGNVWARYLLGVPGTALTGYALLKQLPRMRRVSTYVYRNTAIAASMFLLYGIFSGLVVPDSGFFPASFINDAFFAKTTGIPIQVFRTVCAVVISYNIISILNLFAQETLERLRSLSLKDELTGLLNRRGFFTLAEQQVKIAKRQKHNMLLLIGDMNNLKQINDASGHAEGDAAIIETAEILRKSFRESDIIARIGGDEFAILQVDSIGDNATASVDRLQNNFVLHNEHRKRRYLLSMSVGAALCDAAGAYSINEVIQKADEIMYEQKRNRNNGADGAFA
jgi:diguanylate cyclase (GGDEF)-like protein